VDTTEGTRPATRAATRPVLAVHGGAGTPRPELLVPERLARCRDGLAAALRAGWAVLADGGAALDATVAAVVALEDDEEFNAGRGSVLNADGEVETDAGVVDGDGRRAGAVGALRGIRNPVRAARAVLDHSPHVLLVGEAAAAFAVAHGCETAPPEWFVTERRRTDWERSHGTVGAVALDADGHLAAATSTGGVADKAPGRVGDTPVIGAGTWADDETCAVSATGLGEALLRAVYGHRVHGLVADGRPLLDACTVALDDVVSLGGRGGCCAVDRGGNVALPFTTAVMYRGWIDGTGRPHVAIEAGEPRPWEEQR
jgi:isoaspartyl peptidase/L-asparaginase-like protein (Ntn-hydrolase superfamily)